MARTAVFIIKTLPSKVVLNCVSFSGDLEVKILKKIQNKWIYKNVQND